MMQLSPSLNLGAQPMSRPAANTIRFGNESQKPPADSFQKQASAADSPEGQAFMNRFRETMDENIDRIQASPEYREAVADEEAKATAGLGLPLNDAQETVSKVIEAAQAVLADPDKIAVLKAQIADIKAEVQQESTDPIAKMLQQAIQVQDEILVPMFQELITRQETFKAQPDQLSDWAQRYCQASMALAKRYQALDESF